MHKRDYVLIASAIKGTIEAYIANGKYAQADGAANVAEALAGRLANDPAFKRDVFLKACGLVIEDRVNAKMTALANALTNPEPNKAADMVGHGVPKHLTERKHR